MTTGAHCTEGYPDKATARTATVLNLNIAQKRLSEQYRDPCHARDSAARPSISGRDGGS
jgi:hypothetical protein